MLGIRSQESLPAICSRQIGLGQAKNSCPSLFLCWDKSRSVSCGATRLDVTELRPLCAYHHMPTLVTKVFSVAPTEVYVKPFGFALRSPFGSAFSCCNLTACSSLRCKYQSLLLSFKGLSVMKFTSTDYHRERNLSIYFVKNHKFFYKYIDIFTKQSSLLCLPSALFCQPRLTSRIIMMRNPAMNPKVAILSPSHMRASGRSSCTTT